MNTAIFILMLSLLVIHEMDAIRSKEWKMFIVLKDMADEKAYRIFTLIHLPLYFAVIFLMAQRGEPVALYYITNILLICHTCVHYGFKKHTNNGFISVFSNTIIYSMGILAVIHIILILIVK